MNHSLPKGDFTNEFSGFFIKNYYNLSITPKRQGATNVSITQNTRSEWRNCDVSSRIGSLNAQHVALKIEEESSTVTTLAWNPGPYNWNPFFPK